MATSFLDQIKVAAPCKASWEDMDGNAQVRHCNQCSLNVYNISEMTTQDATALIQEKEGKLCLRMYKRPDGTLINRDCPVGVGRRRRMALIGAGLAAALAGIGGVAFGLNRKAQCTSSNVATTVSTPSHLASIEPFKTLARIFPGLFARPALVMMGTPVMPTNWQQHNLQPAAVSSSNNSSTTKKP